MFHLCMTCVQTVKEVTQNGAFLRQNCGAGAKKDPEQIPHLVPALGLFYLTLPAAARSHRFRQIPGVHFLL